MLEILNWFTVFLILAAATGLLLSRDWRWSLGSLAVQYLGVFWLVYAHWPVSMAAAKLVTGWMACAVLGMVSIGNPGDPTGGSGWLQGRPFRLFAGGLVLFSSYFLAVRAARWLGIELPVSWGGLLLIGMGLLGLGITTSPFRVAIGLLTLLSGFEILYAAVETSVLVAALLAVVTLGLALAGAYLLNATPGEGAP